MEITQIEGVWEHGADEVTWTKRQEVTGGWTNYVNEDWHKINS
jgi:hypothetical protein